MLRCTFDTSDVGNWKEGGGRGAMQQQQQLQQDQQQNGTPTSGGAAAAGEREADRDSPAQPIPPHAMIRPGQLMPMGSGGPMIPPHFRGMMPPYVRKHYQYSKCESIKKKVHLKL